jgi:hypothetical protein
MNLTAQSKTVIKPLSFAVLPERPAFVRACRLLLKTVCLSASLAIARFASAKLRYFVIELREFS